MIMNALDLFSGAFFYKRRIEQMFNIAKVGVRIWILESS